MIGNFVRFKLEMWDFYLDFFFAGGVGGGGDFFVISHWFCFFKSTSLNNDLFSQTYCLSFQTGSTVLVLSMIP